MGIRIPAFAPRHKWKLAIAGAVVLALAVPGGIYGHWAYEGSPQFCASCHIMDDAHATWERSAHKMVGCKECHVQDLFGRMRLAWQFVVARPKAVGPHTRLDEAVCKRCHEGGGGPGGGAGGYAELASIAGTPGHRVHHDRARLSCLECHARKLHVFEPDVGRCRECHTERVALPKMRDALAHEKGGNDCLACHKFLEPGHEALAPDRATCAGCHDKPSVVALLEKSGKPFHAECRDCHAVHGRAFQDPVDCFRCHVKILNDKTHIDDGRLQEKCTECHEPHKWKIE